MEIVNKGRYQWTKENNSGLRNAQRNRSGFHHELLKKLCCALFIWKDEQMFCKEILKWSAMLQFVSKTTTWDERDQNSSNAIN